MITREQWEHALWFLGRAPGVRRSQFEERMERLLDGGYFADPLFCNWAMHQVLGLIAATNSEEERGYRIALLARASGHCVHEIKARVHGIRSPAPPPCL